MPTENRSSNTELQQIEAAGAAMTQIRTMLGREQRPEQVALALEACDWSDTPIGNKAIILSAIRALRAPQPHPEPIAWMVGAAIWWTKEEAERDAAEVGLPVVGIGPMTESIPYGYCLMPRRLTAENSAKALLLGEFKLEVTRECPECRELEEPAEGCEICDGEGEYGQRHIIPWDNIKHIYSAAVRGLAILPNSTREPA